MGNGGWLIDRLALFSFKSPWGLPGHGLANGFPAIHRIGESRLMNPSLETMPDLNLFLIPSLKAIHI
jgi:hypothetical protein